MTNRVGTKAYFLKSLRITGSRAAIPASGKASAAYSMPAACSPSSIGSRYASYDKLSAELLDKCLSWAEAHAHPERPEQTIWEVFEEERPKLVSYRKRFDGPRLAGLSVEDLPGPVRQKQIFDERQRNRPPGRRGAEAGALDQVSGQRRQAAASYGAALHCRLK